MSMVRVDPNELIATAAALRAAAAEAADVGTGLASCVNCPMPPDVASLVTGIVSVADAICDHLALQLDRDANDLTIRAAVAALDIASPGSVTTTAPAPIGGGMGLIGGPAAAAGFVVDTSGTSVGSGMGLIGGAPAADYPTATSAGSMVLGGTALAGNHTMSTATGSGSMIIGGVPQPDGPGESGVRFIPEMTGGRYPSGPSGVRPSAMTVANFPTTPSIAELTARNGNITGRTLIPSLDTVKVREGRNITTGEYAHMYPGGFTGQVI